MQRTGLCCSVWMWLASIILVLSVVTSVSGWGAGQTTIQHRLVTPGSISGRVTLDDTNGPARFAAVSIQPVEPSSSVADAAKQKDGDPGILTVSRIVRTTVDGSFLISHVAPGTYYVMVDADPYLSAAGLLTREQLDHPTKKIADLMARLLVPVVVMSGRNSTADVRLHRGGSLSGTVRFDDGAPFEASVRLFRMEDKGVWKEFHAHLSGGNASVDDLGRFRFVGLPEGSYRVSATLSVDEEFMSRRRTTIEGWMSRSLYSLQIYSPNTTREKDAKIYQLSDGQDEEGVQIEVPLGKLHSLAGSLVEKASGRPINAGHVSVLFADDGKELMSTDVSAEDDAFHLAFVPEGSYTLRVTNARDADRIEVLNPSGAVPPSNTKEKTLQSFGQTTQSITVTTDVQGLLIAVPSSNHTDAAAVVSPGADSLP
ncbi:carboxypeptidase-like regulatory domain-containing protein [Granulicella arctica]|uniref:carboxypeptidase-like regulatory domain-containing protein n=1 Tax=Granulicella arctica TaxID=940613 RepID=UPI0021E01512|nr:carboxypeptidase-like regulatory domain-containing protein [Granulicella arctica]